MHKFSLWHKYLPTYLEIEHNKQKRKHMKSDPGYKWMKRMTRLVIFILYLLYAIITIISKSKGI